LRGGSSSGALNAANTDVEVTDVTRASVDVYSYPAFEYEYSYDSGLSSRYAQMGIVQVR